MSIPACSTNLHKIGDALYAGRAPLLFVRDLHAAYLKREILRGVSLTVNRGEIVTVVGGNGSGKSTLLKTIAGIIRASQGCIDFQGESILAASVTARQRMGIGYLLQGGHVFPHLTVTENMNVATTHHRDAAAGHVAVGSVFPDLRPKAQVRAGLLSGGERQMLAVEMVMAQEPALALLDEPTAALSSSAVVQVLASIKEFVRRTECGVVLVEQNVYEARGITDRQLTLVEGVVSERREVEGDI